MRGLGGVFIAYALIGYPVIGLLGGHPLRDLPVFGLAPCASVTFFFGLLVPLARALTAVPRIWPRVSRRTTGCSSRH